MIREIYGLKQRIKNYQVILVFCIGAIVNLRQDFQNSGLYIVIAFRRFARSTMHLLKCAVFFGVRAEHSLSANFYKPNLNKFI